MFSNQVVLKQKLATTTGMCVVSTHGSHGYYNRGLELSNSNVDHSFNTDTGVSLSTFLPSIVSDKRVRLRNNTGDQKHRSSSSKRIRGNDSQIVAVNSEQRLALLQKDYRKKLVTAKRTAKPLLLTVNDYNIQKGGSNAHANDVSGLTTYKYKKLEETYTLNEVNEKELNKQLLDGLGEYKEAVDGIIHQDLGSQISSIWYSAKFEEGETWNPDYNNNHYCGAKCSGEEIRGFIYTDGSTEDRNHHVCTQWCKDKDNISLHSGKYKKLPLTMWFVCKETGKSHRCGEYCKMESIENKEKSCSLCPFTAMQVSSHVLQWCPSMDRSGKTPFMVAQETYHSGPYIPKNAIQKQAKSEHNKRTTLANQGKFKRTVEEKIKDISRGETVVDDLDMATLTIFRLLYDTERLKKEDAKQSKIITNAMGALERVRKQAKRSKEFVTWGHLRNVYLTELYSHHHTDTLYIEGLNPKVRNYMIHVYSTICIEFYNLLVEHVFSKFPGVIISMKEFALVFYYMFAKGYTYENTVILPKDLYLANTLPETNTLQSYSWNKNKSKALCADTTRIQEMIRRAIKTHNVNPILIQVRLPEKISGMDVWMRRTE